MANNPIFGGNPLAVVIRLVLLSIVVGVILSALGITPDNLVYSIRLLASRIYHFGFETFEWAFGYFLLGALIVVPIWIVTRVIAGFSRKSSGGRDDRA